MSNRVIKFRAWDGSNIRYDVTGFEHGDGNEMSGVFLDGDYFSMNEKSTTSVMEGRYASIMQFTGLYDKNGKEIYEGDIVEAAAFSRGEYSVVVSANGCFVARHPMDEDDFCFLDDYDFKVIGNIYENPELLKETDA